MVIHIYVHLLLSFSKLLSKENLLCFLQDGSVDLKAHDGNGHSIRLFVSTKPCPYQSAPTKVSAQVT